MASSKRTTRSRRDSEKNDRSNTIRLFLGGASENDRLVNALEKHLKKYAIVDSWRTVFHPGASTLESLRRAATAVDFAAFVWGREDRTISRQRATASPRDNVVYEAGLFAGYLGYHRTFVVHAIDSKIPTDYLGVTTIQQTNVHDVSAKIEQAIAQLGPMATSKIVGCWWQLVTSGDVSASVVSFFQIVVESDSRLVSMQGTSWNRAGRLVAAWRCPAAAFDEKTMTLHYSWEGVHTQEAAIPTYFGVGEINFHHEPFFGSFSSTPRNLDRDTFLRRARYVRALPADSAIINGDDVKARRRLIQQRLRQRMAFVET